MAGAYLSFLKRCLPSVKFTTDSRFSWFLSTIAFFYIFTTFGIVHCLGVFFKLWMVKYQVTESTILWVQSAYYACQMVFGPLVVALVHLVPGQILIAVASVISCIAHTVAATQRDSVLVPIITIGCIAGICGSFFSIYPMNLVAKAFKRFRPIALAIVNLGAPVGAFIMPYAARSFLIKFGLDSAVMALGVTWLINMVLAIFLVEIKDEDPKPQDGHVDFINEGSNSEIVRQLSVISITPKENMPKESCNNRFCLPVVKSQSCICLMIYGFFHYGGMAGLVIFLPVLLTESFMPLNLLDQDAVKEGQDKVTTALAVFGVGGILGDILFGLGMTFGPFVDKRFSLFVGNNMMLLIVSVLLIFSQSFKYICVLVTLVGFFYEAWFAIIWTLTYDLFSISDAPDVSGILFFCRGIATVIVPVFQTLILEATASDFEPAETDFLIANGTSYLGTLSSYGVDVNVNTLLPQKLLVNVTQNVTNYSNLSDMRSFGNQMVMTMLCGLLSLAIVCQVFMYFLVIKNLGVKKVKQIQIDCAQTNDAFL